MRLLVGQLSLDYQKLPVRLTYMYIEMEEFMYALHWTMKLRVRLTYIEMEECM